MNHYINNQFCGINTVKRLIKKRRGRQCLNLAETHQTLSAFSKKFKLPVTASIKCLAVIVVLTSANHNNPSPQICG